MAWCRRNDKPLHAPSDECPGRMVDIEPRPTSIRHPIEGVQIRLKLVAMCLTMARKGHDNIIKWKRFTRY